MRKKNTLTLNRIVYTIEAPGHGIREAETSIVRDSVLTHRSALMMLRHNYGSGVRSVVRIQPFAIE